MRRPAGFLVALAVVATWAEAPRAEDAVLAPRPRTVVDTVTVTATRGARRIATPGAATVVPAREILARADATIDETLRGTPGFALFRRASASASNPTTQGVALRGLSTSGASRALVLADGVPLNDPFGSWVPWDRVPLVAIDRVEVVRGSAGDLYGPDALGGIVQVLTFPPGSTRLRALADGATRDAGRFSGLAQAGRGGWDGSVAGEWQRSPGYVTAAPEVRGPIDVPTRLEYGNGFAAGGWRSGALAAHVRAALGNEDRGNGTPAQVNDTRWQELEADLAGALAGGAWQARATGEHQQYHQTFSAIAADRASERLTSVQRIPTDAGLGTLQWSRDFTHGALLVGGEWKDVHATIDETRFPPAAAAVETRTGGRERQGTAFARLRAGGFGRAAFVIGARLDQWRSRPYDPRLPAHAATMASPRASLSFDLVPALALEAAAYRAWRTPTLNELDRGFRAGNVVTNPNPALDPERFTGAEAGLRWTVRHAAARVTAFVGRLNDAITNVTVSVTPTLITRVRENEDRLRTTGLELEAETGPFAGLTTRAFAVLGRARFDRTPEEPALQGLRVPEVPDWQVGGSLEWDHPRIVDARIDVRGTGRAFDDDLNQLPLAAFGVVDFAVRRSILGGVDAFFAAENLLDAEVTVARTPTRSLGTPRTLRAGLTLVRGDAAP